MAIVSRRSLNMMLNDLSAKYSTKKYNALIGSLEHKNTQTALAAEAELLSIWAVANVANAEIEPEFEGTMARVDLLSADLLQSGPAAIEITALSDDSFSGEDVMLRTANIVSNFANQIRADVGKHLSFRFNETSGWNQKFVRTRSIDASFELTESSKALLTNWLKSSTWPSLQPLRVIQGKTDIEIAYNSNSVTGARRVSCSMPTVAYDIEDNPVFKAIGKKAKTQLRKIPASHVSCLILVDVGSYLLRTIRSNQYGHEVSGKSIIRRALQKFNIDLVCILSAQRENEFGFNLNSKLIWKMTFFDRREGISNSEYAKLNLMVGKLPPPRFDSFQARSLHRINALNPQSAGWYLPTMALHHPGGFELTIKISSRLLTEYLAQRIDGAQFQHHAFANIPNLFEDALSRGLTIQNVEFESCGPAADDDYLIFDLAPDWAAIELARRNK